MESATSVGLWGTSSWHWDKHTRKPIANKKEINAEFYSFKLINLRSTFTVQKVLS
jgi:hypothetical protein